MGVKLFNELSIDLRKTESFKQYEELLKKHFTVVEAYDQYGALI